MAEKIRILIVDDHAIMRGGLRAIIGFEQDMEVVGEASDGYEAVDKAIELDPDVILMDLLMPGKDGIEAMADIRAKLPEAHFLVLTSFAETDKMLLAVKSGAQGYILKKRAAGRAAECHSRGITRRDLLPACHRAADH